MPFQTIASGSPGSYSAGMRVTGGILRGRTIRVPRGDAVRPTQDMVRQALFSSLAARIPGCRFLDLFAGSGAVGLDAWSRGAAYVCWVEGDSGTYRVLEGNLQTLCGAVNKRGEERGWRAVRGDGVRFLGEPWLEAPFDVVFADPPYDRTGAKGWGWALLAALLGKGRLAEGGVFVLEQASDEVVAQHPLWGIVLEKEYGGTRLVGYRKVEDDGQRTTDDGLKGGEAL